MKTALWRWLKCKVVGVKETAEGPSRFGGYLYLVGDGATDVRGVGCGAVEQL